MKCNYFIIRPDTPIQVLNPPQEKKMKIIFYAVIQLNIWQYDDKKSSIYIRFGRKELGNWKTDIGPCDLVRFVIMLYACVLLHSGFFGGSLMARRDKKPNFPVQKCIA